MKNKTIKFLIVLTSILIVIDQLSKILVENLVKKSIEKGFFGLEARINTGMALGFNEGNIKNIILTVLILGLVIVFIKNQLEMIDKRTTIALSMVLSGGLSNLIDRLFRGGVYDFIKIKGLFVFNIADILVVVGWILIIVSLINFQKNNKDEETKSDNTTEDKE